MPDIVTFDPIALRIIEIDAGDNELTWAEIYSEWKVWIASTPQNMGHPQAFREVGGDPTSDTKSLGISLFLMNGWKMRPAEGHHTLRLVGNIFTDPAGQNIIVPTLGSYTVAVEYEFSNLIDLVTVNTGGSIAPTQQYIRDAMTLDTSEVPAAGSIDQQIATATEKLRRLHQMRGLEPGTAVDFAHDGSSIEFDGIVIEGVDIPGNKKRITRTS